MSRRWLTCLTMVVLVLPLGGCGFINLQLPDLVTILQHIEQSFPQLTRLVTAISYVMGIYFFVVGVYKLKLYGEMRTMMSNNASMKPPMLCLLAGAALVYWPTMLDVMLQTVWGYGRAGIMEYTKAATPAEQVFGVMVRLIQLLGLIAFIRGWVIIGGLSKENKPAGTLSKGVTHIMAGTFAVNFLGVAKILGATVGSPVGF